MIKMNLPEVLKQQVNGTACVCVCVFACDYHFPSLENQTALCYPLT